MHTKPIHQTDVINLAQICKDVRMHMLLSETRLLYNLFGFRMMEIILKLTWNCAHGFELQCNFMQLHISVEDNCMPHYYAAVLAHLRLTG